MRPTKFTGTKPISQIHQKTLFAKATGFMGLELLQGISLTNQKITHLSFAVRLLDTKPSHNNKVKSYSIHNFQYTQSTTTFS